MDAQMRRPGHPLFDPSTVHIPPAAMGQLTPVDQQYWAIKKKNMNTVVAFKVSGNRREGSERRADNEGAAAQS
jgi:DNA mismatch repair protein MSH6